jgi:cellulose synthase/poly-beta-1,6-N-acetylglucosamine synthase-like glycosyltransferase
MFTAEYAAQFDVLLPCLAAFRLPLPLGGSSNHFRTAALRAVGGWDPHNVTEDADLGIRLARFGYRSSMIASSTHEEAPADVRRWLYQRTRWFKGWMQTWLVHMRAPRLLLSDLGAAGFATFQLIVGGSVLAALVYPLFLASTVWQLATGQSLMPASLAPLHVAVFLGGLLASTVGIVTGLSRRRLLGSAWIALLAPLHWLLLSVAAWRALRQFLREPFRWEKTEHGLAKSSRMSQPSATQPADPFAE